MEVILIRLIGPNMVWLKLIGHAQTRMQENNLVWSKLTRPDVLELIVSDWNLSPNCNLSELNKHETYFFKGEENVCKKKKDFVAIFEVV